MLSSKEIIKWAEDVENGVDSHMGVQGEKKLLAIGEHLKECKECFDLNNNYYNNFDELWQALTGPTPLCDFICGQEKTGDVKCCNDSGQDWNDKCCSICGKPIKNGEVYYTDAEDDNAEMYHAECPEEE